MFHINLQVLQELLECNEELVDLTKDLLPVPLNSAGPLEKNSRGVNM